MLKKVSSLILSTLLATSLSAGEYFTDFYVGWRGVQQNFSANTNLTTLQTGIGLGGRFWVAMSDEILIGGEAGFSHIETHWDISGNITHLQFALKIKPAQQIDIFGGIGIGLRGAPEMNNTSPVLAGTMGDLGVAFIFGEENWRVEAVGYYFNFSGNVNNLREEVTSWGAGVHLGKTFLLY
ncbi:MAG: hypothetical protein KU37_08430 [Sulfuricurvum sp. PC08-66]|nr:MAG: hypothetical protein KU37_08430 [Sulfuricurvum sp. PC08-66]